MDSIYLDYENSLIGRKKELSSYHFYGPDAGGSNQVRALQVIRYAIEKVLCWSKEDAVKKFDMYIIKLMKLEKVVSYVRRPDEVDKDDTKYILSLLYPDMVHMSNQKLVEDILVDVIHHERPFPREYFAGAVGFYRYCSCVQYLMVNYKPVSSIEEMYEFLTSYEGKRFLDQYRIKVPKDKLGIDICDVIHTITKDLDYSDLMYSYFKFKLAFESLNKEE